MAADETAGPATAHFFAALLGNFLLQKRRAPLYGVMSDNLNILEGNGRGHDPLPSVPGNTPERPQNGPVNIIQDLAPGRNAKGHAMGNQTTRCAVRPTVRHASPRLRTPG
ncbi:hypothetical protein [Marinovum sp.]|uniref:hypothetical protein n=1 Tax=Marinovum sp. TaxID=2024839 RepID=UPI003A953FBA